MRRHVVSTIYNNFIYMYINSFEKRNLANGLARKTKKIMHRVFRQYNNKGWLRI